MKNGKGNGIGVSEPSRQSTVHSRQIRGTEERGGRATFEAPFVPPFEAQGKQGKQAKAFEAQAKEARPYTRGTNRGRKEIDARVLWKQVEDVVVAQLGLSVIDHVIYVHLLRHSQLEGKRRLHFSIPWLAHNINLSTCPTREAVRRLAACGVLRLVERSKQGHVAEVRLPHEVRGVRAKAAARAREAARKADPADIEQMDFVKTIDLRRTIHARERGPVLLLLAASASTAGVPGPCGATGASGVQFVPQPGLGVHGMQRAERGAAGG